MKPKIFLFLLLSLYIVNCTLYIDAQATIRYVSKTGSSTPPFTSWATAADSIQECISICSFGDTVYVANGVYKERVDMIPGLSLIGSGMDSCLVDTRQLTEPYYSIRTYSNCYLSNFNVYCHNTSDGVGVDVLNSIMENCKIQEALFGFYARTSQSDSSYVCKNIVSNVQDGIICEGKPLITENVISASGFGLISQILSSPIYLDNIIMGNPCYKGFSAGFGIKSVLSGNIFIGYGDDAIDAYQNDSILNNVIYGLNGKWNIGVFGSGTKVLNNNIQNTNAALYYDQPSGSPQIFKYNNLWSNGENAVYTTIDSTNIFNDPMFVNADSMNFHLQKYSPLIDAGDPTILDNDGSRSDIGLFGGPYGDSYKYIDLAPRAPINLTAVVDTNYITLKWNRNSEADTSFYKVYRDTVVGFIIDSTKLISSQTDTFFVQLNPHNVTKYVYKVTCVDKHGNESQPSTELVVNITSVSTNDYPMTISDYQLYQNYPNPFNPTTTISYRLKESGYVKLYVYDIQGELISTLVNQQKSAGFYEIKFNVAQESIPAIASGIYIYQLMVKSERDIPVFTDIKKMLMIK